MSEITTVGLDLAKNVFQAHGADASGRAGFLQLITSRQIIGAEMVVDRRIKEGDPAALNDWGPDVGNPRLISAAGVSSRAPFLCFHPMISLFRFVPATKPHGGAVRFPAKLHWCAKSLDFSLVPLPIGEAFLRRARQFNSIIAPIC